MAGKCPSAAGIKKLKGGVNCIDTKGNTCFCSSVGCKCGNYGPIDFGQGARNVSSQMEWCAQYDPTGANNKWCLDHMTNPDSAGMWFAKGTTDATKDSVKAITDTFSAGNITTIAVIGIAAIALFMIIS